MFVTERAGAVRVVDGGAVRTFLDLTDVTLTDGPERGLLSMAFAPDYATSGRFYVYLTAAPAGDIQVREYRRSASDPDAADPGSARLLLAIAHSEAPNHNGGQLQFGPDGKLWLATGDGGGGNDQLGHAQDPASLLGKLIRLDPAAPTPEIVAVGLRNPWRFSFDRATGLLTIGDVGQGAWEEIDAGVAANYGWPCFEGAHAGPTPDSRCASGTALPVLEQPHPGFCSIIGGYVVRDPGLPSLFGRYLYGDDCAAPLRSLDLAAPATDAPVGLDVAQLSSFGQDVCGRLFVVSLAGPVSRLVDGAPSPCGVTPAPPAAAPPRDTRPCSVTLRVTGLHSVRRRHYLSVALRTDEACRATVSAARFRSSRPTLRAGTRRVVRLRITARGLRTLRRHRSLRVKVRVQAVDSAGNVRRVARTVRVR